MYSEFEPACNSAKLHKVLSTSKMKECEALDEYVLVMKKSRSPGNIEDSGLIYYVSRI